VKFDIVMGKAFPLDDAGYTKITGLYKLQDGMAEFNREDDLLIFKYNGQLTEGLLYKGNNSFEGGLGYFKVKFEILAEGKVKAIITQGDWESGDMSKTTTMEGMKFLKYKG